MFKKTVEYVNFNEEKCTKDFYFHLSKTEVTKLVADDEFLDRLNRVTNAKSKKGIIAEMEGIVRLAIGVRSEDGESFIKNENVVEELVSSPAYDELIIEFMMVEGSFVEFIKQLLPEKMQKELLAQMGAPNPNETVVELPRETRPKWLQENRKPTEAELQSMSKEEMQLAFAKFN